GSVGEWISGPMKRCLIFLLALPLLGCVADQQRHLAGCISEAEREYPQDAWLMTETRQSFVWFCMAAHGYRRGRQQAACSEVLLPTDTAVLYAQCYRPTGRLSLLSYRIETAFRRARGK